MAIIANASSLRSCQWAKDLDRSLRKEIYNNAKTKTTQKPDSLENRNVQRATFAGPYGPP